MLKLKVIEETNGIGGNLNLYNLEKEISQLASKYEKLIFICNPALDMGTLTERFPDAERININLILSERLLGVSKRDYVRSGDYIQEFLNRSNCLYVLEHIDILFDPALRIDPITLLKNLSRSRYLIVVWPGEYRDGVWSYANPNHPEYYRSTDSVGVVFT